jgi:hypothetical protein
MSKTSPSPSSLARGLPSFEGVDISRRGCVSTQVEPLHALAIPIRNDLDQAVLRGRLWFKDLDFFFNIEA